jgi:hypothetical protein
MLYTAGTSASFSSPLTIPSSINPLPRPGSVKIRVTNSAYAVGLDVLTGVLMKSPIFLSLQFNKYWGLFPREVKRPKREADHSHPSSAEVKNVEQYLNSPHVFMAWCLIN